MTVVEHRDRKNSFEELLFSSIHDKRRSGVRITALVLIFQNAQRSTRDVHLYASVRSAYSLYSVKKVKNLTHSEKVKT